MFDQRAFIEAVGIAATTIAQAGIEGGQGGPSNLQRFRAHHPPTFTGGGDTVLADHWFMQIDKVLEAMEITSDASRIRLVAFQLEGEAQIWWKLARTSRDLEAMTWAEFQELFMGCICMCCVVIVQNFGTKFLLRRGECKTREIPISGKREKIVISVTKF